MTENTPLAKAQGAAQELLNRTQDATRQFIEAVTESTEALSADVAKGARGAVESVSGTRERFAGDLKTKAEPTAEQVATAVNELIAWARRNSERVVAEIDELRSGLEARLAPVSVVTKADLAALEARVAEAEKTLAKVTKGDAARATKTTAAKATAAKATAAKATPAKVAAKKAPAAKAASAKVAAKKAPAAKD